MAAPRHRPGRTLVIFFLGVAVLYGLVALTGVGSDKHTSVWKPALGLDLEGGTQITLTATKTPTKENLDEARRIIDQRVNASGVSETSVTTQGSKEIVVAIPKSTSHADQLEQTAERQAVLRFRMVACSDQAPGPCAQASPSGGSPITGNGRPAPGFGRLADKPGRPKPSSKPTTPSVKSSATPSGSPSGVPSATPLGGSSGSPAPSTPSDSDHKLNTATGAMAWMTQPDPASVAEYNKYTCDDSGTLLNAAGKPANLPDDPAKALVACSTKDSGHAGIKYLLSPSVIEGGELTDAVAAQQQQSVGAWEVNITLGNDKDKAYPKGSTGAEDDFATITDKLHGSQSQFAIVLDGKVISALTMEAYISDGRSSITGNFNQESAQSLATSLKYGSLPIAFKQPTTLTIGPSLAGNQLHAGMIAGAIGLALVMLYCLLYYRGLGMVVVASLFVAAAITYALVLLLAKSAGFTLTLPGIAGLIIAVGITADSFVIFFERIRDEMREGKSMRVAVESGWHRARITRLAANTVSVLSALVLYIFASGVVKGFGFALGLSTIVDLAVLFWFTKPMVSYLAQFKAFNSGRDWSGLSRKTLGMDAPSTGTARGEA